jgi:hypothetical protein
MIKTSVFPSLTCHLTILYVVQCPQTAQKRKHEGMEDSADVHKHKKSKVAYDHCCLSGTTISSKRICYFVNITYLWQHKSSKTDEMANGLS